MFLHQLLNKYFAPQHCCICQEQLLDKENVMCHRCSTLIRCSNFPDDMLSPIARLFWGIAPIIRGGVLFDYQPDEPVSNILTSIKYKGKIEVCRKMGKAVAGFYMDRQFFEGIDVIVPVPLSRKRYSRRGYNQSEEIARGIADVTGLSVDSQSVLRIVDNSTQTHLTQAERMANVEGIFCVKRPEMLRGKHILVVDDVITTGATVGEVLRTISASVPDASFSVMALARGGLPSFCL